jgi:hypothetical protein
MYLSSPKNLILEGFEPIIFCTAEQKDSFFKTNFGTLSTI